MPLVVLTRSREDDVPPDLVAAVAAALQSQTQLVTLAPDARQMIATDSGHYIQLERPQLVIEAIRQVVEGVHHPNTWSDLVACCAP
jgi:pimeloyl-ACP methyl ester carboxylesterase